MPPLTPEQLRRTIETLYRTESGRVLATLVRLLGDLDMAEESMHEAFAAALEFESQLLNSGANALIEKATILKIPCEIAVLHSSRTQEKIIRVWKSLGGSRI